MVNFQSLSKRYAPPGLLFVCLFLIIKYHPDVGSLIGLHKEYALNIKPNQDNADSVHSHLEEQRFDNVTDNQFKRPNDRGKKVSSLNSDDEIYVKLRQMGLESIQDHKFKSPYITVPRIYSDTLTPKAPGKREKKIISCFHCPKWFVNTGPTSTSAKNRDFKVCPYSECFFDTSGRIHMNATAVLFFPTNYPDKMPKRPPGQIWINAVTEPKPYYNIRSKNVYGNLRHAFNWTVGFSFGNDFFWPANFLAWRATETLLSDDEYIQLAKKKTRTATWWTSRCGAQSKRLEYVKEMQKYVDVDIYGDCGNMTCLGWDECASMLNDTYKFYLAFENSFCKDYVTEKFFRSFKGRRFVVPVVRGGIEYEKYFPPASFINSNDFKNAKDLGLYLKELVSDIPKYAEMLKEKDRLTTTDYKTDWCDFCEMLHTDVKERTIPDLHAVTHAKDMCWTRDDIL